MNMTLPRLDVYSALGFDILQMFFRRHPELGNRVGSDFFWKASVSISNG